MRAWRVIVVGDYGVGKTELVTRMVQRNCTARATLAKSNVRPKKNDKEGIDKEEEEEGNDGDHGMISSGVLNRLVFSFDFMTIRVWVNGCKDSLRLQFVDTAAMERTGIEGVPPSYYRGAKACLLCFDVTNRESWKNIESWHNAVLEHCGDECHSFFLVSTKIDKSRARVVSLQHSRDLANKLGAPLLETSARYGTNLEQSLHAVGQAIFKREYRNDVLSHIPSLDEHLMGGAWNIPIVLRDEISATVQNNSSCCNVGSPQNGVTREGKPSSKLPNQKDELDRELLTNVVITNVLLTKASQRYHLGSRTATQTNEKLTPGPGERFCPWGCGKILKHDPDAFIRHTESECGNRYVTCKFKCGDRFRKNEEKQHLENFCPNRMVICSSCCTLLKAARLGIHEVAFESMPLGQWGKADVLHWMQSVLQQEYNSDIEAILADDVSLGEVNSAESLRHCLGVRDRISKSQLDMLWASLETRRGSKREAKQSPGAMGGKTSPVPSADGSKHGDHELKLPEKYAKMFKSGLPMEVVQHAMKRDGIAIEIAAGVGESKPDSPGEPENQNELPEKYAKMLKSGLPMDVVRHAMKRDGIMEAPNHGSSGSEEKENPGQSEMFEAQEHKPSGNDLLASITKFDRLKLKKKRTSAPPPAKPSEVNGNSLIKTIASFDRSKLRKVSRDKPELSRRESSSAATNSPLFAALSKAISERRDKITGSLSNSDDSSSEPETS